MVSLFMDSSSEMIHSLLPIFMTETLGLSALYVGLVEGIGEGLAQVIRVFSGTLSDNIGRRKPFMILGYGIGALSKPFFALASSGWMVLSARAFDRIGKGIRTPPRDAIVADLTPASSRGAAYGFRQSLDTAGAFLGPLLAMLFMYLWNENVRLVFAIAIIPAMICLVIVVFAVKEPKVHKAPHLRGPIDWRHITDLGQPCWLVILIGGIINLSEFSEAFIILKASQDGLSPTLVPLVLIVMNLVYSVTAYPIGRYSDKGDHEGLLMAGMVILIAANMTFAASDSPMVNMAGVVLWGLHYGITQGLLATMIANTAPDDLRATAFGVFGLVAGVMSLCASLIAGFLWTVIGISFPFYASIIFCMIAIVLLLFYPRMNVN